MQPRFESIEPGQGASFACREFSPAQGWPFIWHFHPEYELTLITRGSGQRFVGDDVSDFRSGDLVLLGANLPHTWYSRPPIRQRPHRSVVIQFLEQSLGQGTFDRPELARVRRLLDASSRGIVFTGSRAAAAARRLEAMLELTPLQRMTELLLLLDEVSAIRSARPLASRGYTPAPDAADQRRLQRLLHHVNSHYTDPIRLADLARIAHLSESACCRFFSRHTGKPLTRYVNALRIGRACELIRQTDRNIAVIALDCGFGNLSNFNRRFSELRGMPPRAYRTLVRQASALEE